MLYLYFGPLQKQEHWMNLLLFILTINIINQFIETKWKYHEVFWRRMLYNWTTIFFQNIMKKECLSIVSRSPFKIPWRKNASQLYRDLLSKYHGFFKEERFSIFENFDFERRSSLKIRPVGSLLNFIKYQILFLFRISDFVIILVGCCANKTKNKKGRKIGYILIGWTLQPTEVFRFQVRIVLCFFLLFPSTKYKMDIQASSPPLHWLLH